jgi:crooked neck
LINLELSTKIILNIRETFEQAILNLPKIEEKRFWRRYIYLWYNYALFEELDALDLSKAGAIYSRALNLVPHKKFTFSKLWIMTAHFHVR